MITEFKIFEKSVYDIVKPYFIDKYVIIKPAIEHDKRYYLIEITSDFIEDNAGNKYLRTNKLYTLYPDNRIERNKHQYYNILIIHLDNLVIYKSSNIKDAYDMLASIHDSKKYNL